LIALQNSELLSLTNFHFKKNQRYGEFNKHNEKKESATFWQKIIVLKKAMFSSLQSPPLDISSIHINK
jgi:hypothetical protein